MWVMRAMVYSAFLMLLSDVPGFPGAKFSSFDRPALSGNGMNWAITAVSDSLKQETLERIGSDLSIDVIHNFIDEAVYPNVC